MIKIEDSVIRDLFLTKLINDGDYNLSNSINLIDEIEESTIKKIFLSPFITNYKTYEFNHEIDIELNPLFNFSRDIFNNEDFHLTAKKITKHLKTESKHHNIKSGDLFIIKIDDILYKGKYHEAIGIFKFEEKEKFLETSFNNKEVKLNLKEGIGSRKADKACIIIFTKEPYSLLIIDSKETDYWQQNFLKVIESRDEFYNTKAFLDIAKSYVTEQMPEDFEVEKTDKIDMLNRSVEYFKENDSFNKEEFETQVFQNEDVIESFRSFDDSYRQENAIEIKDDFDISTQAVKKQQRLFKSILKLDKNFHVYIHGDKNLIEKGIESDGRKFYKIYYEKED